MPLACHHPLSSELHRRLSSGFCFWRARTTGSTGRCFWVIGCYLAVCGRFTGVPMYDWYHGPPGPLPGNRPVCVPIRVPARYVRVCVCGADAIGISQFPACGETGHSGRRSRKGCRRLIANLPDNDIRIEMSTSPTPWVRICPATRPRRRNVVNGPSSTIEPNTGKLRNLWWRTWRQFSLARMTAVAGAAGANGGQTGQIPRVHAHSGTPERQNAL